MIYYAIVSLMKMKYICDIYNFLEWKYISRALE